MGLSSSDTLDDLSAEELNVREWRTERFVRLGFDDSTAKHLAACADADVARVRALLGAGCPQALVVRIVC